jgi:hypothetical protein
MTKTVALNREDVYSLVWSVPIASLTKRYKITEYQLRQLCIRWSVPLPRQFHWRKVRAGESIEPPPLPSLHVGETTVTLKMLVSAKRATVPTNPAIPRIIRDDAEDILDADVRKQLVQADRRWLENGLVWTKGKHFRVGVAPANIDRACYFLNIFLKEVRRRGYRIELQEGQTLIHIGSQPLPILLRERTKREIRPDRTYYFGTYHLVPSGNFYLHMTYRFKERDWKIGDGSMVDEVKSIIVKLEAASQRVDEYHNELERGWARIAEERRVEREKTERRIAELGGFKNLLHSATRWQQAQWIRNYIDAMQNRERPAYLPSDRADWVGWASAKADWYDPLIEAHDEWLANVNRDTLS